MAESVPISIIIPVYNSAQVFPVLYNRLVDIMEKVIPSFEIIAVTDGCSDNSADVIAQYCEQDNRLKLIEFSRNFGNQMGITAGLKHCRGEMVVIIDDDLEDPPEVIPELMKKADEGYDVVYAIRRKREISSLRYLIYKSYYKLLTMVSSFEIPENVGDFCLMKRQVVDALNSMPENNRYIRGLRAWTGFRQTGIIFDRERRHSGSSGFNIKKYIKFAIDGMLSFSNMPLVYVTFFGFIVSFISLVYGCSLIILKLSGFLPDVPGWASLAVMILFLGGGQLISIGVLGLYVSRINDEVKRRPPYIIKRSIGLE